MIRPVSHPATGRMFDLAAEQPASVITFLADLRENLPSQEHGLICESAAGSDRERGVYVIRRPGGGYSVRHFPGSGHHTDHHVIPESDQHKRGKDYFSDDFDRSGLPAAQEVATDNRARFDVATLEAPRIIAVEFQAHNRMTDREYRGRTTRAMHAKAFTGQYARALPDGGVLPVWVHAFGMPSGWAYPVPSVAAQDQVWDSMPKPGSVTGIGPRCIEAERCRPTCRWDRCPRTGGNYCGSTHPLATVRPSLRVGEIATMAAGGQLVPIRYFTGAVYLVSPEEAALYEELGGSADFAVGAAGGRSSAPRLGACRNAAHSGALPSGSQRCDCPSCRPRQAAGPGPTPRFELVPPPASLPRSAPMCVRCGIRPAIGLCPACKAFPGGSPLDGEPWAECSRCRRRMRNASPDGRCYDCQHGIPVQRRTT